MEISFHAPGCVPEDALRFWQERLPASDEAAYFTSGPEWFGMMCGDDPAAGIVVAGRDDGGAVRLILPLLRTDWHLELSLAGRRLAGKTLSALKTCGTGLIRDAVSPSELKEAWEKIGQGCSGSHAVWVGEIVSEQDLTDVRESCSSGGSFFVHPLCLRLPSYRQVLPPTLEDCLKRRSVRSRNRILTKERALSRELGRPCSLVEVRSVADWAPYSERIEQLMNSSWQAQWLGHRFALDTYEEAAGKGWVRGFLLVGGESVLAFTLCYQAMGRLIYGRLGYDRRFGKYSPGTILQYRMLERLYDRDTPRVIDFGEGEADYKAQWADVVGQMSSLLIVRRTRLFIFLFGLYALCRRLDVLCRLVAEKLGLKRRLKRSAAKTAAAS